VALLYGLMCSDGGGHRLSYARPFIRQISRMMALWSSSPSPFDTMSANNLSTRVSIGSARPKVAAWATAVEVSLS
jgi:hypothetical protein